MSRLFGTDGVRGLANRLLTPELALRLSEASARVLTDSESERGRPRAVVGRDPRVSGEFLSAAVVAGLTSSGVDVWDVGVIPTPAVAFLVESTEADFGVVLSASHNPMPDNGIKFFARGGTKLPDAVEDQIEAEYDAGPVPGPVGAEVGRLQPAGDARQRYVDHLVSTVSVDLTGLKVVVDGANGAASTASPAAMRALGAEVIELHTDPDGYNINLNCGSTHPGDLQAAVVAHGAAVGIAHDGDADRCLAVDATGQLVDGDQIMAILAVGMHENGRLEKDTIVATVMSNLGFRLAMTANDIAVVETAVGDRYVLEAMLADGYNLGGEQSGHVIMRDFSTTGDGTLTALHLLARVAQTGDSLASLATVMTRLPQVLINVRGVDKTRLDNAVLVAAVSAAQERLGDQGRVLLRPSGTEQLVRVMVEAAELTQAQQVAEDLVAVVTTELAQ
ncbi:phosphoglucosamine mutase [Candidatus Nanopelagicales bacterium]|nr:phosphoglucosamine mutase [Candidatus Nanopelagicales bacterium]